MLNYLQEILLPREAGEKAWGYVTIPTNIRIVLAGRWQLCSRVSHDCYLRKHTVQYVQYPKDGWAPFALTKMSGNSLPLLILRQQHN